MLCQTCGTFNADAGAEYCARCKGKLLVVSGPRPVEDDDASDW